MTQLRSHIRSQIAWIAVMDLCSLLIGSVAGVMLRLGHEELRPYVFDHLEGWLVLFSGVILANYLAGSYRLQYTFSRFNLVVTWLFSVLFAILILSMTSYAWLTFMLGRGVLFLALAVYSAMSLILKLLVYRSLFRREVFQCRTVLIGTGAVMRECRRILEGEFVLPAHKVVAYVMVGDDEELDGPTVDGVVVVDGRSGHIGEIARCLGAHLIVADFDDSGPVRKHFSDLKRLRFEGIEVLTPLIVAEIYSGRTPLEMVSDSLLMQSTLESNLPVGRRLKRIIDVLASSFTLVLWAPMMAVIGLAIKLTAPRSPVFYTQTRVGQFGKQFRMLKFRTMIPNAEALTGPTWSQKNDPRITAFGRFLRRFRLDEMPQLANILRGEMTIVGPRPERPELVEKLASEIPCYEERNNMVPGLTGWAQIQYPYGSSVEDAKRKLEYDLYYMKHLSFSLDLQIVLRTLRIVVLGKEKTV
ncbi:MAG: sugar transferase [Lentisphaerae bacterium]|nr:sugar transferase [Lentisphaerota bacterium]